MRTKSQQTKSKAARLKYRSRALRPGWLHRVRRDLRQAQRDSRRQSDA